MRFSIPLSFLFFAASSWSVDGQVPSNDLCSDAIVISTADPTTVAGTYENATADVFSLTPDCHNGQIPSGAIGVWYKIEGIPDGRELEMLCDGEDCLLVTNNDGSCDSAFDCVPGAGVGRRDNDLFYSWTTGLEGHSTYFVLVGSDSDAEVNKQFTVTLTDVTAPSAAPSMVASSPPTGAPVEGGTSAPTAATTEPPTVEDDSGASSMTTSSMMAGLLASTVALVAPFFA